MPFSPTIDFVNEYPAGTSVNQVSIIGIWKTVIAPGGIVIKDKNTVRNPVVDCDSALTSPFRILGGGTHVLVRLGYDKNLTAPTSPIIKLLGRTTNEGWDILHNEQHQISVPLTMDLAKDAIKGPLAYTMVRLDTHMFNCKGNNEIIIGVETALAATGDTSTAIVQVKII